MIKIIIINKNKVANVSKIVNAAQKTVIAKIVNLNNNSIN